MKCPFELLDNKREGRENWDDGPDDKHFVKDEEEQQYGSWASYPSRQVREGKWPDADSHEEDNCNRPTAAQFRKKRRQQHILLKLTKRGFLSIFFFEYGAIYKRIP